MDGGFDGENTDERHGVGLVSKYCRQLKCFLINCMYTQFFSELGLYPVKLLLKWTYIKGGSIKKLQKKQLHDGTTVNLTSF